MNSESDFQLPHFSIAAITSHRFVAWKWTLKSFVSFIRRPHNWWRSAWQRPRRKRKETHGSVATIEKMPSIHKLLTERKKNNNKKRHLKMWTWMARTHTHDHHQCGGEPIPMNESSNHFACPASGSALHLPRSRHRSIIIITLHWRYSRGRTVFIPLTLCLWFVVVVISIVS